MQHIAAFISQIIVPVYLSHFPTLSWFTPVLTPLLTPNSLSPIEFLFYTNYLTPLTEHLS